MPSPHIRVWASVVLLAFVCVLNYLDRFLPAVLAEPIKADLGLSDTAIGVINGFGFLAVYALMGLVIARIADRGAFGAVIAGCVTLWGLMTALGGLAGSGLQLALTRMGVAVGEAGSVPAAHAYVARNFAPNRRAAPLAMITMAIPVAGTAGFLGGGILAETWGWRTTFIIMGTVSVVLAPAVLALIGVRQTLPAPPAATPWPALLRKRSFLAVVAGTSFMSMAGYALTTFTSAFLIRSHAMSLREVGLSYGISSGAAGIVGLLVVGRLADRLAPRDPRWPLWLVVGLTGLLLPASALAFLVTDQAAAVTLLALSYAIGTSYLAPSIAAIQRLARPQQRATASAIFLFFNAVCGALGPLLVGLISDALTPELHGAALGQALLFVVPAMQVLGIACYAGASVRYRDDLVEVGG